MQTINTLEEVFIEPPEYISTYKPLGIKEVPKITINCLNYNDDQVKYTNKYQFFLNNLQGYYEEYDTKNGVTITLATPILAPLDYDALTIFHRFSVISEEIGRDTDNKDTKYYKYLGYFNHVSVKHKVYSDGEPTVWYITFSYKKSVSHRIETKKEEKKETKQIMTKPLRSVKSETLSEVKL